jgi:hypothetical protein
VNNPAVFRKFTTVFLLAFWLLSIYSGSLKNDKPGELSNAHTLVKPDLLNVGGAITAHEYKQKNLPGTISGATALDPTVRCVGLQRNKEISEHSKRSLNIYELNRALLI